MGRRPGIINTDATRGFLEELSEYFNDIKDDFPDMVFSLNDEDIDVSDEDVPDFYGNEVLIEAAYGEVVGGVLDNTDLMEKLNKINNGSYAIMQYDSDFGCYMECYGAAKIKKRPYTIDDDAESWGSDAGSSLEISFTREKWAEILECEEDDVEMEIEGLEHEALDTVLGEGFSDYFGEDYEVDDSYSDKEDGSMYCLILSGPSEGWNREFAERLNECIKAAAEKEGKVRYEVGDSYSRNEMMGEYKMVHWDYTKYGIEVSVLEPDIQCLEN